MSEPLLVVFGMAVFHAVTHVAVHDAKERITEFFHRPERLRNHDLQHAVERTIRVVLRRLQEDYQREYPHLGDVRPAFNALALASVSGPPDETFGGAADLLSVDRVSAAFARALNRDVPEMQADVRTFVVERFPALFVFAFREIGLKGDEKVRAVIFESMFQGLGRSAADIQSLLIKNDDAMRTGLAALGVNLTSLDRSMTGLMQEVRELRARLEHESRDKTQAYLCIADADGVVVRTETIRSKRFVIGRRGAGDDTMVSLDDKTVSRVHAEFVLTESGAIVQDRKSTHGTWINGEKITGAREIGFGTTVQVGRFNLYLLPAEGKGHDLLAWPTQVD